MTSREETIRRAREALHRRLRRDTHIPGCVVVHVDPYDVGTDVVPRYVRVALRGREHVDVLYRGFPPNLQEGQQVTVLHIVEGDLYEVFGPSGTDESGAIVYPDPAFLLTKFLVVRDVWSAESAGVEAFDTFLEALTASTNIDVILVPPGWHEYELTEPLTIDNRMIAGTTEARRATWIYFYSSVPVSTALVSLTFSDVWDVALEVDRYDTEAAPCLSVANTTMIRCEVAAWRDSGPSLELVGDTVLTNCHLWVGGSTSIAPGHRMRFESTTFELEDVSVDGYYPGYATFAWCTIAGDFVVAANQTLTLYNCVLDGSALGDGAVETYDSRITGDSTGTHHSTLIDRASTFDYTIAVRGTPPLTVSSTELVTNLNADLLDGYHAADLLAAAEFRWPTKPYRVVDRKPVEYETIQSAIDASSWGDTIYIPPGVYTENLMVDRGVRIVAVSPEAAWLYGTLTATHPWVTVENLRIHVSASAGSTSTIITVDAPGSLFLRNCTVTYTAAGPAAYTLAHVTEGAVLSATNAYIAALVSDTEGVSGVGVKVEATATCDLVYSTVEAFGVDGGVGVRVASGGICRVRHSTIRGSTVGVDSEGETTLTSSYVDPPLSDVDDDVSVELVPYVPTVDSLYVYEAATAQWKPMPLDDIELPPANHAASHTEGGSDSFQTTDVIAAAVRRAVFGTATYEFGDVVASQPLTLSGGLVKSDAEIHIDAIHPSPNLSISPTNITGAGWGVELRSNDSGKYTGITWGRTSQEGSLGVAASTNQWLNTSVAGDTVLRASTGNLLLGTFATGQDIRFITGGATGVERLRVSASGNVGIGNFLGRNPQYTLTLHRDAMFAIELPTPSGATATPTSGGSLAAGTYYIRVVASGVGGTTLGSTQVSATVDGSTTNAIQVSWSYLPGAINFRVYVGTTSGGQDRYWTVTSLSYKIVAYGPGDGSTPGTVPTECTARTVGLGSSTQRLYGDIYIGDPCPGRTSPKTALHIVGPNAPTGASSALDIQWEFSAAGNAAVRAYRGGSYDTYLQFLTSPTGSSTPIVRASIDASGNVALGSSSLPDVSGATGSVDIGGDTLRLRTSRTPASSGSTGKVGEICWDADYIYVCVATNTWKRVAISTW